MWREYADDVYPPITGDPYSLTRDEWSEREARSMWVRYFLAYLGSRFLAYAAVGLLAYPLALVIQWLRLLIVT